MTDLSKRSLMKVAALTALADEAEVPRQRELIAHLRAEVNALPLDFS